MPRRLLVSDRASGVALVVAAVTSLQFGAGFAVTLFDELGPAGAAFLRLAIAAAGLLAIWRPRGRGPTLPGPALGAAVRRAIWRPRVRGHTLADLRVAAAFGAVLGTMNFSIYQAMDRIPLGVAVT